MDKRTIALTDQPTYAGTYYVPVDDSSFSEARKMALSVILGTEATTRAANDVLITVGAGLGSTGAYTAYANSWYLRAADFTTGITDRGGASANLVNSLFNADRILDAYIHDIYNLWEVGAGVGSVEQKGNSNLASGVASLCVNGDNIASGDYSTCFGRYNTVAGDYSISSGSGNANAGNYSYSFGASLQTTAGSNYSMVWGRFNIVSGSYATALGYYSIASGDYSFAGGTRIAGAFGSIASGECSFCFAGGQYSDSEASGADSAILGGKDQTVSGDNSAILGGLNNSVSGDNSTILGGESNFITSDHSIASGHNASASMNYSKVHGFGQAVSTSALGVINKIEVGLVGYTTDNVAKIIYIADESTDKVFIESNSVCQFTIRMVAIQTGGTSGTLGDSFSQTIKGCIKNIAGTTSIEGSTLAETAIKNAAFGGTVAVTADNTNDCLQVQVTGENDKYITWAASIELVKLKYTIIIP